MNHTSPNGELEENQCDCETKISIPFLDTSISIENGKLMADLYKKPTDKNQYLLPYSCHLQETIKSIPFSLALRITRICSKPETREQRFLELKNMLLERKYQKSIIDAAIRRARAIPRAKALQKVAIPNHTKRPVYAVSWDPRLPSIAKIQGKHWRSMTLTSPYLREVYPQPPLTAYRRQKNIRDFVIRAKVPPPLQKYPKRRINGMKKCKKSCVICPFIKEGKVIKSHNFEWHLNRELDCRTRNIVYMIQCNIPQCNKKYIGESERTLKDRISEHIGYIRTGKLDKATGIHFNQKGHSLANMIKTIIEKVNS